jgi:hypothetical protein
MAEQTGERVEIEIRHRLSDFLWLNLRARWRSFLLTILILVLLLPAVAIFATVQQNAPLSTAVSAARAMSPMWILMMVVGPVIIGGVPILSIAARWYLGQLPRSTHVAVDEAGVTFSGQGYDTTVHWEQVRWVERSRAAYFFRLGPALLRVPRRCVTPEQQTALDAMLARRGL